MSVIAHDDLAFPCPTCNGAGTTAGAPVPCDDCGGTGEDVAALRTAYRGAVEALREIKHALRAQVAVARAQAREHKDAFLAMREENGIIRNQLKGAVDALREIADPPMGDDYSAPREYAEWLRDRARRALRGRYQSGDAGSEGSIAEP